MNLRKPISEHEGIYFLTLTCCKELGLFEMANAYNAVYRWFDYLKSKGHFVLGYVIMPGRLHAIVAFRNTQGQSINSIIGNGKRFMAYEIVSKLKQKGDYELLDLLAELVNTTDRSRGKLHNIFEPSFDWKNCQTGEHIQQKLEYMHELACVELPNPVTLPWKYRHSSARFYLTRRQGIYQVTNYKLLKDIDLSQHYMPDEPYKPQAEESIVLYSAM